MGLTGKFLKSREFLDTLVKDGVVNYKAVRQFLDGLTFIDDIQSKATQLQNGLVRLATDQQAIDKTLPEDQSVPNSLVNSTYQTPDIVNTDGFVTITEEIWNITDGVVAPNTDDETKLYRKRYLVSASSYRGQDTMVGGTKVIAVPSIQANSVVLVTAAGTGVAEPNAGAISYAITPGVGFTVYSTDALDNRAINWFIV